MRKWVRYNYRRQSPVITWFGCFASMAEGVMFIKQHGASCRLANDCP